MGLLGAVRSFNGSGTFRGFAVMCIKRRLITALKVATAGKNGPLNSALRVIVSDGGDETDAVEYGRSALGRDPHIVAVENGELAEIADRAMYLSDMERRAIGGVLGGYSYCEIEGVAEGAKPKWVDNAVQRARKKLAA